MEEVLLFIPTKNDIEKRLTAAMEGLPAGVRIRVLRDADSLRRRLVPGGAGTLVVVIVATTKEDLESALSLRELLMNFRIVMILPAANEVTRATAWRMWPRFVSYADGDFSDVAGVVQKLIGTKANQEKETSTYGPEQRRDRDWSPLPLR